MLPPGGKHGVHEVGSSRSECFKGSQRKINGPLRRGQQEEKFKVLCLRKLLIMSDLVSMDRSIKYPNLRPWDFTVLRATGPS